MGLDVYLYKCDDIKAHLAWEGCRDKHIDDGPGYGSPGHDERAAKWDAEHPDPAPEEQVEIDSRVLPEHMFKIGYLRSSYNDGGTERVIKNATGKGLHFIFGEPNDYIVEPNWGECLKRAIDARESFDAHIKEHGSYGVMTASRNMFEAPGAGPASDADALATFRAERLRWSAKSGAHRSFGSSYGNRDGEFFMGEPLKVAALIGGTENILGKRQVVYAIFEKDLTWYQQALQIVVEMIEWVIAQPNPQKFYLHWSG